MKYKKTKFCATLLLCFGLNTGYAQQALNPSGGNATGSGGSESYVIGQIFNTMISGSDVSVIRDLEQPYQISSNGLKNTNSNTELSIYPNPTASNLNLFVKNSDPVNLRYQLFDTQGNLLESKQVTGNQTLIKTNNLPPANYLLKIIQEDIQLQSFKIVKF